MMMPSKPPLAVPGHLVTEDVDELPVPFDQLSDGALGDVDMEFQVPGRAGEPDGTKTSITLDRSMDWFETEVTPCLELRQVYMISVPWYVARGDLRGTMTPFEDPEADEAWRITFDQDSFTGPPVHFPDDIPLVPHSVWHGELTVTVDVAQREDGCVTQIELRLTKQPRGGRGTEPDGPASVTP